MLEQFNINMRHAANELNFQVEDNCAHSLRLKNYLVNYLNMDDIRTFGICIGIKTRKKSEIFSSILIRKRYLLSLGRIKIFPVYDILRAKDFNPNERTEEVFSSGNPRAVLPEQLRRVISGFYVSRKDVIPGGRISQLPAKEISIAAELQDLYQCKTCFTVYDETMGEAQSNIPGHTLFGDLPPGYCCPVCESGKDSFVKIDKSMIGYVSP